MTKKLFTTNTIMDPKWARYERDSTVDRLFTTIAEKKSFPIDFFALKDF